MRQSRVYEDLVRRIETGHYQAGDRLPPERSLAVDLGVSRTVLRSALSVLEAEGRIWRGVGKGTFIAQPIVAEVNRIPDVYELSNPAEIMEVRLALEPALAAHAAQRASLRELDEVSTCQQKAAAAKDQFEYEQWDGRFHRAIAVAARNRLFLALFDAVNTVRQQDSWAKVREAKRYTNIHPQTTAQHKSIVNALKSRSPQEASRAMATHLETVGMYLLSD